MPAFKPLAERFAAKSKPMPSGCIEWTGCTNGVGYGIVNIGDQRLDTSHRVAWQLKHGAIPRGKFVCHKCDNRLCVNPDHLFIADHRSNMADMRSKSRSARGERNGHAKLSATDVLEIRRMRESTTLSVLARRFRVSPATISDIVSRRSWMHV